MERERVARENEEKERVARMNKIKEQFDDPNSQWEKDKSDMQKLITKEKEQAKAKEDAAPKEAKPNALKQSPANQPEKDTNKPPAPR